MTYKATGSVGESGRLPILGFPFTDDHRQITEFECPEHRCAVSYISVRWCAANRRNTCCPWSSSFRQMFER